MISCVSSDLMCDYNVLAEWSQLQLKDSSISEPQHNIVSSVRRFGDNLYISVPRWKVSRVVQEPSYSNKISLNLNPPVNYQYQLQLQLQLSIRCLKFFLYESIR